MSMVSGVHKRTISSTRFPDSQRFTLLRGTPAGPIYLARPDRLDADTWTEARGAAWRFSDSLHAHAVQETVMARTGFAVAVVSDQRD